MMLQELNIPLIKRGQHVGNVSQMARLKKSTEPFFICTLEQF